MQFYYYNTLKMKPILTFIFIIVAYNLFGQKTHHQMISSQGKIISNTLTQKKDNLFL